ncbi:MAG: four helix bundle protein [Opitutaceae bacterium]|nr:four helix bundle protein [Opitutaceae bacterium]
MATYTIFEEMPIWQQSRSIAKQVYELTCEGKFAKDFGLRDQLQRSAVSVMSNIAEGFERTSKKAFANFLNIAKGSLGEARSQITIARDIGYIEESQRLDLANQMKSLGKEIGGFMKYLRNHVK